MTRSTLIAATLALFASIPLFAQSGDVPAAPQANGSGDLSASSSATGTGKVTTSPPGPSSPIHKSIKKKIKKDKRDAAKDDHATIEKVPPANPANH